MTSFLVVPGLLLASGEACLLIPFVPGLDKAEKFALFWESVMSVGFSDSLILLFAEEMLLSLSLRFLWLFSSSFFCWSWRTRLFALERGMHHCHGQTNGRTISKENDLGLNPRNTTKPIRKNGKMADISCKISPRKATLVVSSVADLAQCAFTLNLNRNGLVIWQQNLSIPLIFR